MAGYFYDKDGFPHYYYTLDELLDEARAVLGDDYVRALQSEMQDEIQSQIDKYELEHDYDDEDGEVCICLGVYKDSKSAKIAMNFIQNNNNCNYRKACGHIEPKEYNSDGYIFDMITQEEVDKVLEYFTDEDGEDDS